MSLKLRTFERAVARRGRKAKANPTGLPSIGGTLKYNRVKKQIENPTDSQLLTREAYGEPTLACPVCGHWYSHVVGVYTLIGGDEGGTLYRGSHLVARQSQYRRDGLAVRVHGECDHVWDLVFQQHKGVTLVHIHILKDQGDEELNLERV